MVSSSSYEVRPTAIYANPVLLDLIDREMKAEYNVVLATAEITGGLTVKTLSTQAGNLPLIPEWTLPYTGTGGPGSVLPAYIVTEDMIEYHWRTAKHTDDTECRGEVWSGGGEGCVVCALRGQSRPVGKAVVSCQFSGPCYRWSKSADIWGPGS